MSGKASAWWVGVGGLLTAGGSLLPWATITTVNGTTSISGIDAGADGVFTLVIGTLVAGVGGLIASESWTLNRGVRLVLWVAVGVSAAVWVVEFVETWDRVSLFGESFVLGSIGYGLWTVATGLIVVTIGLLNLGSAWRDAVPASRLTGGDVALPPRVSAPIGTDTPTPHIDFTGTFHITGDDPEDVPGAVRFEDSHIAFIVAGHVIERFEKQRTRITVVAHVFRIATDDDETYFTPHNPAAFEARISP